jgi:hypothetical protein
VQSSPREKKKKEERRKRRGHSQWYFPLSSSRVIDVFCLLPEFDPM